MVGADHTRPLLKWLSANESYRRVVVACADANLVGLRRGDLVVRLPRCVSHDDAGLLAQLAALYPEGIELAEHNQISEAGEETSSGGAAAHLLSVFLTVRPFRPGKKTLFSSPTEVDLLAVPLARRTVLGLPPVTKLALDVAEEEGTRELQAFKMLRDRGVLGTARVPGHALNLELDGCVACGVCTKACPEGALTLSNEASESLLIYDPSVCMGELACVNLCPEQAITVKGVLSWQDLIWEEPKVVATVPTVTCARCRIRHHETAEEYCFGCRSRVEAGYGAVVDIEELTRRAEAHRRLLK